MKRLIALAGLAVLAAAPASAGDRGFYAGFDLGQYSHDLDANGISRQFDAALGGLGLTTSNFSSDTSEDGFTYGVLVGYQFLPYVAVEAAYVDLGDAEYKGRATVSDGVTSADMNAQYTTESSGPSLSVLGILPFMKTWAACTSAATMRRRGWRSTASRIPRAIRRTRPSSCGVPASATPVAITRPGWISSSTRTWVTAARARPASTG